MLVLSRRVGEEVIIDGKIHVTVLATKGRRVSLGIVAPETVAVHRKEVCERKKQLVGGRHG